MFTSVIRNELIVALWIVRRYELNTHWVPIRPSVVYKRQILTPPCFVSENSLIWLWILFFQTQIVNCFPLTVLSSSVGHLYPSRVAVTSTREHPITCAQQSDTGATHGHGIGSDYERSSSRLLLGLPTVLCRFILPCLFSRFWNRVSYKCSFSLLLRPKTRSSSLLVFSSSRAPLVSLLLRMPCLRHVVYPLVS